MFYSFKPPRNSKRKRKVVFSTFCETQQNTTKNKTTMSEHDEDKWVRVRTEENERGKRKTEEEEKKEKEMKVVEEEKGEKSTEDKLKEIGETLKFVILFLSFFFCFLLLSYS